MCFLWHYGFYSPTMCVLGNTPGKIAFACADIPPQNQSIVPGAYPFPLLHIGIGFVHLGAFPVNLRFLMPPVHTGGFFIDFDESKKLPHDAGK